MNSASIARSATSLLILLCTLCSCSTEPHEVSRGAETPSSEIRFESRGEFVAIQAASPPLARVSPLRLQELHRIAIGARPGQTIADVGCGSGYYLADVAADVGESGRVIGRDIDVKAIEQLTSVIERLGAKNISAATSKKDDVCLPQESVDIAYLGDVYHIVRKQTEARTPLLRSLYASLRPGGVVVVGYIWAEEFMTESRRDTLIAATRAEFVESGFIVGRHWIVQAVGGPACFFEFQRPRN